jgi:hypothetical protein
MEVIVDKAFTKSQIILQIKDRFFKPFYELVHDQNCYAASSRSERFRECLCNYVEAQKLNISAMIISVNAGGLLSFRFI